MSPIEVRDEGTIRWIGLNRPDKRNAIDLAMSRAFAAAPGRRPRAALRADRALHDPGRA